MQEDKKIMISVLCTAYNHEKYIRQCLDGFMMQKNIDFEVIVHDDASTDKTADIIREYEKKYPNIIKPIYQKENQHSKGKKIYRDFIYPKVMGKYVALCEGDDFWTNPDKLYKQFVFMEGHPEFSACYHSNRCIDAETGNEMPSNVLSETDFIIPTEQCILRKIGMPHTSSLFARKEVLLNKPDFCYEAPVGDIVNLALSALKGKVYYMSDIMSCYRQAVEGSWSDRIKHNSEMRKSHINDMISFFEKFDDYSNHILHDAVEEKVDMYRLDIIRNEKRLFAMLKNKTFKKLPLKTKISFIFKMFFGKGKKE